MSASISAMLLHCDENTIDPEITYATKLLVSWRINLNFCTALFFSISLKNKKNYEELNGF